jgi:S1-C subfamily serine protease
MPNDRPTTRPARFWATAGTFVAVGLVLGLALAGTLRIQPDSIAQTQSSIMQNAALSAPPLTGGESPFVAVVERAAPAVVSIDTRRKVGNSQLGDNDENELFRRFFGDPQGQGTPRGRSMTVPASGSGFLIDHDGRILTNNHVVRDASEITVTLSDKRTFKAKVIGQDPATDVAVIQIKANGNLPMLPLGDSDRIRVGEYVMAIGNPLGELQGLGHRGHHQRARPQLAQHRGRRARLPGLHPDRRVDQLRQLGRAAGQPARRGDRHQHRDQRPGAGHRLRDPDQPGQAHCRAAGRQRQGDARLPRRRAGRADARPRRVLRRQHRRGHRGAEGVGRLAGVARGHPPRRHHHGVRRRAHPRRHRLPPQGRRHAGREARRDRPPARGQASSVQVVLANRDVVLAQAPGRRGGSTAACPTWARRTIRATWRSAWASPCASSTRASASPGRRRQGGGGRDGRGGRPADLAGISEGEILLEANGRDLVGPADLGAVLRGSKTSTRPVRVLVGDVEWSSGRYATHYVPVKLKE